MAGAILHDMPVEGRGFSADDLQKEELKRIQETLGNVVPQLRERGVAIMLAKIASDDALDVFTKELNATTNGYSLSLVLDSLRKEAKEKFALMKLQASEAHEAAKAAERRAILEAKHAS